MRKTRYTINRLSAESGLDRRSIAKFLLDVPSPDGAYSLKDFVDGLLARAAIQQARLEKLRAEGRLAKLEADEKDGQLVDLQDLFHETVPIVNGMVAVIESSALTQDEKDAIRQQLYELAKPPPEPTAAAKGATQ